MMQTRHSVSPEFLPFHSCITHQCGECLSLPSLRLPDKWINLLSTASRFTSFSRTAFSEDSHPPCSLTSWRCSDASCMGNKQTTFPPKGQRIPPRTLLDLKISPVDIGCTCSDHDSITHQHQHKEMHSIPLRYKERGSKILRTVYTDLPTGYPTTNHSKEQLMRRHKSKCCSMESKYYISKTLGNLGTACSCSCGNVHNQ